MELRRTTLQGVSAVFDPPTAPAAAQAYQAPQDGGRLPFATGWRISSIWLVDAEAIGNGLLEEAKELLEEGKHRKAIEPYDKFFKAIGLYDEAVSFFHDIKDGAGEAKALHLKGEEMDWYGGKLKGETEYGAAAMVYGRASIAFDSEAEIYKVLEDNLNEVAARRRQAEVLMKQGNALIGYGEQLEEKGGYENANELGVYRRAGGAFDRASNLFAAIGDKKGKIIAIMRRGYVLDKGGEYKDAYKANAIKRPAQDEINDTIVRDAALGNPEALKKLSQWAREKFGILENAVVEALQNKESELRKYLNGRFGIEIMPTLVKAVVEHYETIRDGTKKDKEAEDKGRGY